MDVSVRCTVRASAPTVRFDAIAREILGASYELSTVLCGDALAQRMNREYRHKTYRPNVLSFPLSPKSGEIFLNVRAAEREARRDRVSRMQRITYLFIHACLHLKGLPHGDRMDALEVHYMRQFGYPNFSLED